MGVLIGRTCAGCKHFFKQAKESSECHRYPPKTETLLLGMKSNIPILHKVVGYPLTHEGMEACGEYVQRIELQ